MRSPQQDQTVTEITILIPALRRFSRTFARTSSDADDLVQDTLLKALSNVNQYQSGTHLKSWLFTIMRNTFLTNLRFAKREQVGMDEDSTNSRPTAPDQEWHVIGRELEEAIGRISRQGQEVIALVTIDGMAYDEAAIHLGCAIGTVKSRLNRARQRLAIEMGAPKRANDGVVPARRRSHLKFDWKIEG